VPRLDDLANLPLVVGHLGLLFSWRFSPVLRAVLTRDVEAEPPASTSPQKTSPQKGPRR
jgi:hypothetical protein